MFICSISLTALMVNSLVFLRRPSSCVEVIERWFSRYKLLIRKLIPEASFSVLLHVALESRNETLPKMALWHYKPDSSEVSQLEMNSSSELGLEV